MIKLNNATLTGNCGKDAERINFQSGGSVVKFSLAVSADYVDKATGEWVNQSMWVDVVCHGKAAETAEKKAKKGAHLYVSGKLSIRDWEDKDGNKRKSTEIVAFQIYETQKKEQAPNF